MAPELHRILPGRTVAPLLAAVVQLSLAAGVAGDPTTLANAAASDKEHSDSLIQQGAPERPQLISSTGLTIRRSNDGEFDMRCTVRSVPRVDSLGRKYVGSHRWTMIRSARSFAWDSDAKNATNDFLVCTCTSESTTSAAYLEFGGGTMRFSSKGGTGTGGGLRLAVYAGRPPASIFQGAEIKFGTTVLPPKSWPRKDSSSVRIEPVSAPIRFRAPVSEFSVVLIGLDQWIDTAVNTTIDSLRVYKQSPARAPQRTR
jgi:hypothetical protein